MMEPEFKTRPVKRKRGYQKSRGNQDYAGIKNTSKNRLKILFPGEKIKEDVPDIPDGNTQHECKEGKMNRFFIGEFKNPVHEV